MKSLLALLVVANLLAFAWMQDWLPGRSAPAVPPAAELAPERLQVIPIERFALPAPASDERGGVGEAAD